MKRFQVYLGNDLSLVAQTSSVDTPQLVGQPRMTRFLDQVLGLLLVLALYELVVFDGVDALLILLSLLRAITEIIKSKIINLIYEKISSVLGE